MIYAVPTIGPLLFVVPRSFPFCHYSESATEMNAERVQADAESNFTIASWKEPETRMKKFRLALCRWSVDDDTLNLITCVRAQANFQFPKNVRWNPKPIERFIASDQRKAKKNANEVYVSFIA